MAQTYRPHDPIEQPPPPPAEEAAGERKRSLGRRVLRGIGWFLGGLVALVVLLVVVGMILLRTEWGRQKVEGIAVEQLRALLAEGAELDVARVEGSFLTGVRILGLEVREGGEPAVAIDTLSLNYNLLTVLSREFSADDLAAAGVRVWARQRADSTWNLTRILEPAPEDDIPSDTVEAAGWTIRIAEAAVRDAAVEAHFYNPRRDSVLTAAPLALNLSGIYSGEDGAEATLDALTARLSPPVDDGVPLDVAGAGRVTATGAELSSLTVQSPRTDLRAAGRADWGGDQLTFDADLQASPLAFADVRQFTPVPLYGTAEVRLQAQGTPEDVLARLNADFEGNGTLNVNGTFSAGADGPVRYVAEGSVVDLDPGELLGNPALAGRLTADLDVDLAGADRETLSGEFDLAVRGSELGDRLIQRADLVGEMNQGRLDFTLGAAVPGARVLAEGTALPFAAVPSYDVEGELNDLDLSRLLRDPEQPGRIRRATFAVEGRGTDPQAIIAQAALRVEEGTFGEVDLAEAEIGASLARGDLVYAAEATLADGSFAAAEGTARPFAEPLVYSVEEGTLRGFDLAAVTGDTTHTDLTGTFALDGRGTDPETMTLDLSARLTDSSYGDYFIESVGFSGGLRGGEARFHVDADLGAAGALAAVGTAQPFAEPLAYEATGTMRSLDLGALTGDPANDSDLTGSFAVDGTGTDPASLAADLRLDLRDSRFRDQEITEATVRGTLRSGDLDLTVDATTPEGELTFAVAGRPFDDQLTFQLSEGSFRGLNLAALTGNPALGTSLNGRITGDFAGRDPGLSDGGGRIVLSASTINGAPLAGGLVTLDLQRGFADAEARLDFPEGAAALAFAGRPFDETPSYDVEGFLDGVDVVALTGEPAGESRVDLQFDVEGEGFDPETMTLVAEARMGRSRLPDARVDTLVADVALASGVLTLSAFDLEADFADATAGGQVALFDSTATTDLAFRADIRDGGPLNAFLAQPITVQSAEAEGRISGPAGGPIALDVRTAAERLTYGDLGAARLDASVNGEYVPAADVPFRGKARVQFGFLALPQLNLQSGDVDFAYLDSTLVADGEVVVDGTRDLAFNLRTEGLSDEEGPGNQIRLESLGLNVDGERWELLQPARITLAEGRVRVRNFLLFSDDQQIAADGVIDLDGEQSFVLTAEGVRLDPFTDLVGYDGVGGVLTTNLSLTGPAAEPNVDGDIRIEDVTSGGETVGALDLDLAYDDRRLTLAMLLEHVSGQELTAEGSLPIDLRLATDSTAVGAAEAEPSADVDLVVRADSFPVAWAEPFLPPDRFTEVGGALTVDARVTGTQGDPQLGGSLRLSDGRLGLITTGTVYRDATFVLDLDGNTARIAEARLSDGAGGTFEADGTITLPQLSVGELAIAMTMDAFRAMDTRTYDELRLTATPLDALTFTGTLSEPVLTGAVTLASGDIYLTDELSGPDLADIELSEAEVQRVEATFGVRITEADTAQSAFVESLDLDLAVDISRGVWLRSNQNPAFDIEFAGTIDVEKEPGGENQLFGTIDVTRGRVEIPTVGRAFRIGDEEGTYGRLVFNGPVPETVIDLRAGFEAPAPGGQGTSATIYLAFQGRLAENPELTLSANPPMEQGDIACVLASGRPCGDINPDIAGDLLVSQLGGIVEGLASSGLGLDVVEVEQRPTGQIVVTFGTYLGDRLYAAASQPVTQANATAPGAQDTSRLPEITIEYELLDWLGLRLEQQNVYGRGGSLLFEFDY